MMSPSPLIKKSIWVLMVAAVMALPVSSLSPALFANAQTSSQLNHQRIEGTVVGVSDGDTLTVLSGTRNIKVRLFGVDTPEKSQAFGQKAKQFTSQFIFGKHVYVELTSQDRYGRWVGWVTREDGANLNQALIKNGWAWWYEHYAPHETALKNLEIEAQQDKRGLWADDNPIAPWEYRRQKRKKQS